MENVRIAVVDDEKADSDLISGYISRYAREKGEDFFVAQYFTAATAAVNCRNGYDIIFMDVELPDGNGIDVIKKYGKRTRTLLSFLLRIWRSSPCADMKCVHWTMW